jgi:hypothetical protein
MSSALLSNSDIARCSRHFSKVQERDSRTAANCKLFDNLASACKCWRYGKTKRVCGLGVNHKLVLSCCLQREISGLFALARRTVGGYSARIAFTRRGHRGGRRWRRSRSSRSAAGRRNDSCWGKREATSCSIPARSIGQPPPAPRKHLSQMRSVGPGPLAADGSGSIFAGWLSAPPI